MYNYQKISNDVYYIGSSDRRIALFENVYPVPNGVSYNSYFIDDEKTVLVDTVDVSVREVFIENIKALLNGRELDYLIINHMEPDHSATVKDVVELYPNVKVVVNQKTVIMLNNFFDIDFTDKLVIVKEGDTLNTGKHEFVFYFAPMVHWPEVMVTYDKTNKTLFSADAFGSFGAINGSVIDDNGKFDKEYMDEARRYFTNIVGKYGMSVQGLLKKASTLEIECVCPLHGLVIKNNIGTFVEKYLKWSAYEPEDKAVLIAYSSVYGNTENAVQLLATKLAERGVNDIKIMDVSVTHVSHVISEAFRCSHIVFAATTYNAGLFVNMENAMSDLVAHNLQNRKVALIENGSWAPMAKKYMVEFLGKMKNMEILGDGLTIKSTLKPAQIADVEKMADDIVNSLN